MQTPQKEAFSVEFWSTVFVPSLYMLSFGQWWFWFLVFPSRRVMKYAGVRLKKKRRRSHRSRRIPPFFFFPFLSVARNVRVARLQEEDAVNAVCLGNGTLPYHGPIDLGPSFDEWFEHRQNGLTYNFIANRPRPWRNSLNFMV